MRRTAHAALLFSQKRRVCWTEAMRKRHPLLEQPVLPKVPDQIWNLSAMPTANPRTPQVNGFTYEVAGVRFPAIEPTLHERILERKSLVEKIFYMEVLEVLLAADYASAVLLWVQMKREAGVGWRLDAHRQQDSPRPILLGAAHDCLLVE